jgi:hypothetical protein
MWMWVDDCLIKGGGMCGEGREGIPAGGVLWGERDAVEVDSDDDGDTVDMTTVCACGRDEWLPLKSVARKPPMTGCR